MKLLAPARHLIKSYYSCNAAVIKAWIKSDSERGLSRAVGYLRSLAMNGQNLIDTQDEEGSRVQTNDRAEANEKAPTVFERIASWGASLLSKAESGDGGAGNDTHRTSPRANEKNAQHANNDGRGASLPGRRNYGQNQPHQEVFVGVGMASRLNYLYNPGETKKLTTRDRSKKMKPVSVGMSSRMALVDTAVHGDVQVKTQKSFASSRGRNEDENVPIGPLPNIEIKVTPDLKTFQIVASGKIMMQRWWNIS
jgi:hypothetical protein